MSDFFKLDFLRFTFFISYFLLQFQIIKFWIFEILINMECDSGFGHMIWDLKMQGIDVPSTIKES